MRFLVHSMQRPGLIASERTRLYAAMAAFYAEIPPDVVLECDYIRADKLGSYSVLRVPDRAAVDRVLAPFEGLVDVDVVELVSPGGTPGAPDA